MPRRTGRTRRYSSPPPSRRSSGRGGRMGGMGGTFLTVVGGLATGVLNAALAKPLGVWNLAVPAAIVSAITRSEALETIAGFETGRNLFNMFTIPAKTSSPFMTTEISLNGGISDLNLLG